jgi:transposase
VLGPAEEIALVAMEATGHYWKNLFAALAAKGYHVALLNPLRTNRFAMEDMQRTKTDAIDALGIARFAAQKRPGVTRLPDAATEELKELVRLRDRLIQDFGDRVRELHRVVDLGFPEFTRYVRTLDSELATAILSKYPTAEAFIGVKPKELSNLKYDGRHFVGLELATQLLEAAKTSVGRHHGHAYRVQAKYYCQDLDILRGRLREMDRDIETRLDSHEVGKLLTTIDGIGTGTAARLIAVLGNPADFRDANAPSPHTLESCLPCANPGNESPSAPHPPASETPRFVPRCTCRRSPQCGATRGSRPSTTGSSLRVSRGSSPSSLPCGSCSTPSTAWPRTRSLSFSTSRPPREKGACWTRRNLMACRPRACSSCVGEHDSALAAVQPRDFSCCVLRTA